MTNEPSQELLDQFAASIESNDVASAEKLLSQEPRLANADLRPVKERDHFTNGYPLFRACHHNHEELAKLLIQHDANPDAPGNNPKDQPELGMPLHFAAADHQNYRLANFLLDHGASPNGYPNCDKATIERVYYHARDAGLADEIVRRAYATWLPNREGTDATPAAELVGKDAVAPTKLFARMVDLGAQPPFAAIVRNGLDDFAMEIVEHSHDKDGTPHDHPNSTVMNNMFGAARWYGYPKLLRRLMDRLGDKLDYGGAICTIGVAIGSHNRDGDYPEYREIIVMQLEHLKSLGELERAQKDFEFNPLYHIATDFTWHENYGYRADIAKPECYVDLAELFMSWGLGDIAYRDPKTGHSPLSAAVRRGHHPGIATYIRWLLDQGADLHKSDPPETNPRAIAVEKGHEEILALLEEAGR